MPVSEPWTREWGRILAFLSASFSLIIYLHPKPGKFGPILWIPKLLAGSWIPILIIFGVAGSALSAVHQAWVPVVSGVVGIMLSLNHIRRVSREHRAFEQSLGQSWESSLPTPLRQRMQQERYRLVPEKDARGTVAFDVHFGHSSVTEDPLYANLWLPPGDVPATGLAFIYIYGGAWHFLDKDLGTRHLFRHLASQGHVVMDITYTRAPVAHLPQMLQDVKQAVVWMKTQGVSRYHIKPDRLVLAGCSSGAHLALMAAYTPNHPDFQPAGTRTDTSVAGVIGSSSITDLVSANAYYRRNLGGFINPSIPIGRWAKAAVETIGRRIGWLPDGASYVDTIDWIPSLLGGAIEEIPEAYVLGSPIHHVDQNCPPTLLLQGAHDFTGITPQVQHLHQLLRSVGAKSIYIEYPATDHAFDILPVNILKSSPAAQAAMYDIDRFLAWIIGTHDLPDKAGASPEP